MGYYMAGGGAKWGPIGLGNLLEGPSIADAARSGTGLTFPAGVEKQDMIRRALGQAPLQDDGWSLDEGGGRPHPRSGSRRMNPLDPRALARAKRRVLMFSKWARKHIQFAPKARRARAAFPFHKRRHKRKGK